jgi:ribosomal protein S18 acetylase RimI-like enzyme
MADWVVELLADHHDRSGFDCGQPTLNRFLREQAGQYARRDLGRTYVAVPTRERRVVGYSTLAAGAIPFAHLPQPLAKKLPKHPLPVIHLGRLAVDRSGQGKGLGRYLLVDAFTRCLVVAGSVGIAGVEVVAIDDAAKAFYQRFGFTPLLDDDRHLFIPIATIRAGSAAT